MGFRDFPTQARASGLLQRSLERGRLGHAYLFAGDSIEELEIIARTLAKTLNCSNPQARSSTGQALDSCDKCSSCRRIDDGQHPDVTVIRPESKSRIISIDQIRGLLQTIHLKPSEAVFKVGLVAGADRLNSQAANAFLKTLEEPPSNSILILLATEPQRLLETIVSRCLRLTFAVGGGYPAAERGWVAEIGAAVASVRHGLIGRYRLLGVLLKKLGDTKAEIEKSLTARSPGERFDDVDPKLRERWEDELKAAIESEYRRQRTTIVAGLLWWLRDVWLRTQNGGDSLLSFPELQDNSRTVAARIGPDQALENLRIIEQTQRLLFTNAQEALVLEVGLLELKL